MSKTIIDATSLTNQLNGGTNRCQIQFEADRFTFSGTSTSTKATLANVADPTNNSDSATKGYVDTRFQELNQGLSWKDPVNARTTANLDGNYVAGVLTATTNVDLPAQDGITLAVNDRLLVMNQTDKSENGIYKVDSVGDGLGKKGSPTPWVLSRASDANTVEELTAATITVLQGSTYQGVVYVQKNVLTALTDNIEFVQTSSAINEISVTDGLEKTGPYVKAKTGGAVGIVSDTITVVAGGITETELANGAVSTTKLADAAVTNDKIATGISADKLAGGVQGTQLADNTLTSNLYGAQSVDRPAIKQRAVGTLQLDLDAVEQDNISDGAVGGSQIENNSVDGGVHIANNSLVTANYGANSVDETALASNSVGTTQLKSNAVTTAKIFAGNVTNAKLSSVVGSEAVDTNVMRDASVTQAKIALASIDETRLANASVTNQKLGAGSITSDKFGTLTSLDVAGGITCSDLTVGGSGGSGSSYQLCRMVFNHINLADDYPFTGSYKRIADNNVLFPYADKVVAVSAMARLVYKSASGHAGRLGFILGVRYWQDPTTPEAFTTPTAFDSFSVGFADTREKEAILSGFSARNAGLGAKYVHSVSWWCKELSGNSLVSPAGQDFISTVTIVNDSSTKQEENWSASGGLTPV